MSKTVKRVSAIVLAIAMIVTFMPMMQNDAFAAKAKKPAKVKNVKTKVSGKKVTISWKKAKNAKKYEVQVKDNSTKLVASKKLKKTKYAFTGKTDSKYTIKVRGIKGKKNGAWSKAAKVAIKADVSAGGDVAKVKAAEDKARKAEADKKAAEDALQAAQEAQKKAEDAQKVAEDAKTAADKKAAEAEKKLADKEAADAVVDAWFNSPNLEDDQSDETIDAVKAVIAAYDALTDDQKALVSNRVKEGIEADRAKIAEIESETPEIRAIKNQIRNIEPESEETVEIDGINYFVIAKKDGMARLLAKDSIGQMEFDEDYTTPWLESSLRKYLNGEFLLNNETVNALAVEMPALHGSDYWYYEEDWDTDQVLRYDQGNINIIDEQKTDRVALITTLDFDALDDITIKSAYESASIVFWTSTKKIESQKWFQGGDVEDETYEENIVTRPGLTTLTPDVVPTFWVKL